MKMAEIVQLMEQTIRSLYKYFWKKYCKIQRGYRPLGTEFDATFVKGCRNA